MEEKKETIRKEPNFIVRLKGKRINILFHFGDEMKGCTLEAYNRFEILVRDHNGQPHVVMKHSIASIAPVLGEGDPDPFVRKEDQSKEGSE